jgi:hypothetical protein
MSKRKGKVKTISAKEKHRRKLTSFSDKLRKDSRLNAKDLELKQELKAALHALKLPSKKNRSTKVDLRPPIEIE